MRTQTRLQANFPKHERAEFIQVSLNFSETQISAEKVPYTCHFVATVFMLVQFNVFNTGKLTMISSRSPAPG